jgi:hypothetical protein
MRRVGYAVSRGEVNEGVVGVAAPVFDGERRLIGSLSRVLAPDAFNELGEDAAAASVVTGAAKIDAQLAVLTGGAVEAVSARVVPQEALGRGPRGRPAAA